MSILYNTNSSLIPKFQRHNLIRPHRAEFKLQNEFQSRHPKDSDDYLKDLCRANWTTSLHGRINKFDRLELSINAFCALIVRNFLGWYGVKIPTQDDQFPTLVFDLIQDTIAYLKKCEIDLEDLVCDQLALILSQHVQAMRKLSSSESSTFLHYCNLTLYQNQYPQLITKRLKKPLDNQSELQSTFLEALFNDLLLGKVLDSVLEPYYILDVLRKLPVDQEKSTVPSSWSLENVLKSIVSLGGILVQMAPRSNTRSDQQPFLNRYIFTFLFQDVLRTSDKKPFLFALFKSLRFGTSRFKPMDKFLHSVFQNTLITKITTASIWQKLFVSLRHMLFPQDTDMGPSTEVPTGEALEAVKVEACNTLWKFIQRKHIHLLFGTTQDDVHLWIEILSKNKQCNKLLCFRIIDCLLANLDSH
ncbi:ZYRO0C03872p [Zygosaccharomyces rouxii]|uniref:ZYRO0C03872p n=1 Tax=Zygosaccharomyces rouxii (strain ATCC 2623 / CBS 732 / NBRC 1130 / NCYC 568 / NRRL Y-229) TaxID=559307 RepID=C5DSY1_ZYGRC|nr:uncharacterized protein ZYRO0C03872g [Zygosaccharomyces rouxii]KAH9201918.1 hypothetical protein LQ764DRAFT_89959 [Zygosaccharomyces rouxii]CAR26892.1 ZYRO0C03872p [Zygosaccharomyces rouxii]